MSLILHLRVLIWFRSRSATLEPLPPLHSTTIRHEKLIRCSQELILSYKARNKTNSIEEVNWCDQTTNLIPEHDIQRVKETVPRSTLPSALEPPGGTSHDCNLPINLLSSISYQNPRSPRPSSSRHQPYRSPFCIPLTPLSPATRDLDPAPTRRTQTGMPVSIIIPAASVNTDVSATTLMYTPSHLIRQLKRNRQALIYIPSRPWERRNSANRLPALIGILVAADKR